MPDVFDPLDFPSDGGRQVHAGPAVVAHDELEQPLLFALELGLGVGISLHGLVQILALAKLD